MKKDLLSYRGQDTGPVYSIVSTELMEKLRDQFSGWPIVYQLIKVGREKGGIHDGWSIHCITEFNIKRLFHIYGKNKYDIKCTVQGDGSG